MEKIDGFIYTFKNALIEIWPMITLFLVIFILVGLTYTIINHKEFHLYKGLYYIQSIFYTLVLYHLLLGTENSALSGINFIPFREITRYSFGSNLFMYNVIGNICIFIPFGLFINAYLRTNKVKYSVLIAIIVSLTAELIQYKIGRAFDVDDVILNTCGSLLGAYIYKISFNINEKLPEFMKKDWFYNIISIIVSTLFVLFILKIWGVI